MTDFSIQPALPFELPAEWGAGACGRKITSHLKEQVEAAAEYYSSQEYDSAHAMRGFLLEKSNPARSKRLKRIRESVEVAEALLGHKAGELRIGDKAIWPEIAELEDGPALVDPSTGEILEAGPGEELALRCALMHKFHAEPENHWVGVVEGEFVMQGNERVVKPYAKPREYQGPLKRHSSRLSSDHMASQRSRSRARASQAVTDAEKSLTLNERLARKNNWRQRLSWKFLTLTMVHIEGATSEREVKRINRAWRLFTKREEFQYRMKGGIKSVEDALKETGPHVHIHALVLGQYWHRDKIHDVWFECMAKATSEVYGITLSKAEYNARANGAKTVDIRKVRFKGKVKDEDKDKEITLKDALEETTKYITTPESLAKLPAQTLLDVELVERWGRMFETFGACYGQRREAQAAGPLLDTTCISAGEHTPEPSNIPDELLPVREDLSAQDSYALFGDDPEEEKLPRPPSWRELMYSLTLTEWLRVMLERQQRARYAMGQRIHRMYAGNFVTLTGRDVAYA